MRGNPIVGVRLEPEIQARLTALANATGRTKAYYMRQAILEHLDDLEDIYLAERRLEDIRAGRTAPVSLEEVMSEYGLED